MKVRLCIFCCLVFLGGIFLVSSLWPIKHMLISSISIHELQQGTTIIPLRLYRGAYVLKIGEDLNVQSSPIVAFFLTGRITTSLGKISFSEKYDLGSEYEAMFQYFDVVEAKEDVRITLTLTIPENVTNSIYAWCIPAK